MNKVENLKITISEIFEQEGPKYYYTPNEISRLLHGLDYNKLFSALSDRSQQVYAFCSIGMDGASHQYYSSKLIPQDASLLWRSEPDAVGCGDLACFYFHELWLLEDMSVVVTSCFQAAEDAECLASEYREIKGEEWPSHVIPINILEMWQFLRSLYTSEEQDGEEAPANAFSPTVMYEP